MHTLTRRRFVAAAGVGAACGRLFADPAPAGVRIGLTPVFLDNQLAFLNAWRAYLQVRLKRPVGFVQRGSYRDVVGLLQQGQLDFAWLCGYPFVRNTPSLRLLAVPLYRGRPVYQSYLIVPAADRATTSLLDLRGKVFAYSDPDSNSGHLHTLYTLMKMREPAATYFLRTFFTYGHRKVVDAVGVGLAHGGAIDGYVWDTLAQLHPELTARTRVVERSPEFGFPPFVAGPSVTSSLHAALQHVLVQMAADPDGLPLLRRLNLDGFQPGHPDLYREVLAMSKAVNSQ